jgi:hypothetical protein
MLATAIFNNEIKIEKSEMIKEIEKLKKKVAKHRCDQLPYGSYVQNTDVLAKALGLRPDFENLKENQPEIFDMSWNNCFFAAHLMFKKDRSFAIKLMKEVDELKQKEYDDLNDENRFDFKNLVKEISKYYTVQNNY